MKHRRMGSPLRAGVAALFALMVIGLATGPAAADVIDVTINPLATVSKPGGSSATISGTITSIHGWNDIIVQVFQDQGQQTVFGYAQVGFPSNFNVQGWSVTVPALGPGFKGGHANVIVTAVNCDFDSCNQIERIATVKLHPQ